MRRVASLLVVAGLVSSGVGCILPDQMKQVEQDVAQMKRELNESRTQQQQAMARLDQIERRVAEAASKPDAVSPVTLISVGSGAEMLGGVLVIATIGQCSLGKRS